MEKMEVHENLKQEWRTNLRQTLTRSNKDWLNAFPEAKQIIPLKLSELRERRKRLVETSKSKLLQIYKNTDTFERWIMRETLKKNEITELREIEGHIGRLKQLQCCLLGKKPADQISRTDIEHAKSIPITKVVAAYTDFKKCGNKFIALCPLHSEKTPSFFIYPDTNTCWCFGCQQGGDSINFLMLVENISFKKAISNLLKM